MSMHGRGVRLLLLINQIKSDLVSNQEIVFILRIQKFNQEIGAGLGKTEMELALGDFVVVEFTFASLTSLVDQEDHAEDFGTELLILNSVNCDGENVAKHCFWVGTLLDGLLNSVNSSALESDANDVLEVALLETLVKLLVNDVFHARVNLRLHFLVVK